ncbi:hypothetical protein ABK040_013889 [Willaertia magna]
MSEIEISAPLTETENTNNLQSQEPHEDEEFVVEDVQDESATISPELELKKKTPRKAVPFSLQSPSQELYTRYVRLEQDFKDIQKAFDLISNEKLVLERVVKQKEIAIEKTQLDYELMCEQADKLKEKIRSLETDVKTLQSEKKVLEENAPIAYLSTQRQKSGDGRNRNNYVLPEDSLDRIIQLENEIKLKEAKISALESEVHTLKIMVDKKDKAIEGLEKQVRNMETKHDKSYELECKNAELQMKIEKANKELKTIQEVTRMKTRSLEELNSQVESLRAVAEEYEDYKKKVGQVMKENEKLKQEIRIAERATQKKDKEINKLVVDKDIVPLKSLEGDKRFLHSEVKKLQEQKAVMERTIQFQDKKMESLRQKLESFTSALKESKIDRLLRESKRNPEVIEEKLQQLGVTEQREEVEEVYPAVLVDLLVRDMDELRRIANERDTVIVEKDTVIESLERKLEIMEKSKVTDQKKNKKVVSELQEQLSQLKESLTNTEMQYKLQENKLKKEKYAAKKTLQKIQGVRKL